LKVYKVLVDGKSCNGGNMAWSLPQRKKGKWTPGKWHQVNGDLEMCKKGIHVTPQPYQYWYKWGCEIYEVEVRGIIRKQEDKWLVRKARLLRKCNEKSWEREARKFVESLSFVPWMKPDGKPRKVWKLFEGSTLEIARVAALDAALEIARVAARDATLEIARDATLEIARDAAWDATWDATLEIARDATWDATLEIVRDAARVAARDAAWEIARDAALAARRIIVGNRLAKKHADHIKARMEVWRKGYCLLCDVDGVLYVYAKGKE